MTFSGDMNTEEIHDAEDDLNNDLYGVEQSESRGTVRLAHFSVREYLVSDRIPDGPLRRFVIIPKQASFVLAETCLVYLIYTDESGNHSHVSFDCTQFPLLMYAARYWYQHAAQVEGAEERRAIDALVEKLMASGRQVYRLATFL
jgi:hypothetical protein